MRGFRNLALSRRSGARCLGPLAVVLALLVALVATASAGAARPGALDRSFGDDGRVKASYGVATSVALHSRRRIVVAGTYFNMARYSTSGRLDHSFGDEGLATTDFPPSEGIARGYVSAIAIDSQKRIVMAGSQCYYKDSDYYELIGCEVALTRHNPDGSTDGSFGNDGTITVECPRSCYGESVAIDARDRIVVASTDYRVRVSTLTRYDIDGNVDESFGEGGSATTDLQIPIGQSMAIDSEGRIVVAGSNSGDFGVARFESDGRLDDSFRNGGTATTEFGRGGYAYAVALRPGGRIVAAGGSDGRFAVVRYRANGKLDHSFSRDGKLTTSFGPRHRDLATASSVAVDSRGRLVAAGERGFKLARYKRSGRPDHSFGRGGEVDASFGHYGGANAAAIDSRDRIVVVGGHTHFLIARFIGYRRR